MQCIILMGTSRLVQNTSASPHLAAYLGGLPNQDPLYRSLRKSVYGQKRGWFSISGEFPAGEVNLIQAERSWRGLKLKALETACGWESRAWDDLSPLDDASAQSLLRTLNSRSGWDMCQLHTLTGAEADHLSASAQKTGNFVTFQPFSVSVIAGFKNFDEYVEARKELHPSTNKEQRRYLRVAEKGGVEFRTDLNWDDMSGLIQRRNRSFANGSDYSQTAEFQTFFKQFRNEVKSQGRAFEIGAFVDGKMIGFGFGFFTGNVYHYYQTAFDQEYLKVRPGLTCMETMIENILNRPGDPKIIDFMGTQEYFTRIAWQKISFSHALIYSRSWKGRLISAVSSIRKK